MRASSNRMLAFFFNAGGYLINRLFAKQPKMNIRPTIAVKNRKHDFRHVQTNINR